MPRSRALGIMVNAIKGLYISCDIPMAQFIINMNASLPQSQKFIIQVLDNTHLFVRPDMGDLSRNLRRRATLSAFSLVINEDDAATSSDQRINP
ncbi:hypothetical protein AAHA92_26198 [Salvia divinorum]|uniref:General transcription and DNA repair factor IIH subunit TFB5 n=1 Tax=Salvia divinorum TaxID=28513 RepID=A0ABD1GG79_SALDI